MKDNEVALESKKEFSEKKLEIIIKKSELKFACDEALIT